MKLIDILRESNELELKEKRRNPEVNYDHPIFAQIENFIQKNGGDESQYFVSFRNDLNTTLINPKNQFNTPTGLYTYPWENYFKIKFIENIKNKVQINFDKVVPFAGQRKYLYLYKLKSTEGILRNDTTYEELIPYVQKLYDLIKDDKQYSQSHKDLVKTLIENPQQFLIDVRSRHIRNDQPITWLMSQLYKLANDNPSVVARLFRSIGVNGLVDYGSGFIHGNEPYQAVFFRGRDFFEKIDYIDLSNKKGDIKYIKSDEFFNKLSGDQIADLIEDSDDPDRLIQELLQKNILKTKFSEKLIYSLLYSGSYLIRKKVVNNLINNHNLLEDIVKNSFKHQSENISFLIFFILTYYNEPEKIIDWVISVNRDEIFNDLDNTQLNIILSNENSSDKLIDKLINIKTFKDKVFSDENLMISIIKSTQNVEKYLNYNLFAEKLIRHFGSDILVDKIDNSKQSLIILKYLINYDNFIFGLNSQLSYVLKNIENPIDIINRLLSNREYSINIDENSISSMLNVIKNNPQEVEDVIDKVIKNYKDNDSTETLRLLFVLYRYTYNPQRIKDIFNYTHQNFISDLSVGSIKNMLDKSPVPDKLINVMDEKGKNLYNSLDNGDMIRFLENSREPQLLFSTLGEKGKDFLNNIRSSEIINYLVRSDYPEKIMTIFNEIGKNDFSRLTREDLDYYKKYWTPITYLKLEKIFKKYRPDLFNDQLQENIKRVKRLIL